MNYEIVTYEFYNDGITQTQSKNMTDFIALNGMSRFIHNMVNKWIWDVRGYDGYEADGECVFINYEVQ